MDSAASFDSVAGGARVGRLWLALATSCAGAAACGDDGPSEPLPPPDYAMCRLPLEPSCVSVACAKDEAAERFVRLAEAQLEAAGMADYVRIVSAETFSTGQVSMEATFSAGDWYRTWAPITTRPVLNTALTDAEVRAILSESFEQNFPPRAGPILSLRRVREIVADCHPDLVYDPCEDHFGAYEVTVVDWVEVQEDGRTCRYERHVAKIDLETGDVFCDRNIPIPDVCED